MNELLSGNADIAEQMDFAEREDIFLGNKYLSFSISNEVYCINIRDVLEIIEMQNILKIPDIPDYVEGVINLRGRIISVVDMRLRFNMYSIEYDDRTCIVIINIYDISAGLVVDRFLEVIDIPEKNIDPPPQLKTESGYSKYITGIGKVGSNVKIMLDIHKIIHSKVSKN